MISKASFKSSLNSPRSSPFRRPASPGSPTAVRDRPATPPSRNAASPMTSPSKLKQTYTVSEHEDEENDIITTPTKSSTNSQHIRAQTEPPPSPSSRRLPQPPDRESLSTSTRNSPSTFPQQDNLSKVPPALLHNLRESFSVLDSSSTGIITPASVSETLTSLGLEANLSQFFPSGQPQSLSLPQYLNQLATLLVSLSPQQELLNAFSAFDDDDSGQIDVAELKSALLNTLPDPGERPLSDRDIDRATEGFTGRRILGRQNPGITGVRGLNTPTSKRNGGGGVFRYQEFVANLTGGPAIIAADGGGASGNTQSLQRMPSR
jgi:Ca2+-binding EF-hand superfamily protein